MQKVAVSVLARDIVKATSALGGRALVIQRVLNKVLDVKIIARTGIQNRIDSLIAVHPANSPFWNIQIIPILFKYRFDLIYCVGDRLGFLSYYLLSKILKYKIIFEITEVYPEIIELQHRHNVSTGIINEFFPMLDRFAVQHADRVIAVADYIREYYIKYRNHIDLVPLFVDDDIFELVNKCKGLKCKDEHITVGLIGPFDVSSGQYYLDYLYDHIDQFDNKIHFLIIGRCGHAVQDKRIRYTGFIESREDYIHSLCALDAALITHKDTDPGPYTKILDCMACSLPVFTTKKGIVGLNKLRPGQDIIVLEDERLVEQLNCVIFDDRMMIRIGENAQKAIKKHYSSSAIENLILDICNDIELTK